MRPAARWFLPLLALIAAGLACDLPLAEGPDTAATVKALGTSVQQTLAAQATPGGATFTPAAATITPIRPVTQSATAPGATQAMPTTAVPITPSSTPTSPPPVQASRRAAPPTIDGDLSDWAALPFAIDQIVFQPANWTGLADQSAAFALAWDAAHLYLAARVTDDAHVQIQHGQLLYRGDSLELQMDTDLAGDAGQASLSGDDFQLGLSPGALNGDTPEAYLWNPPGKEGVPAGVILAARPLAGSAGYVLEAAIPWALFGLTPAPGQTFGFALNSSDNDSPGTAEQQSMISSVATRTLTNPLSWGTLVLGE